MVILGPETKLHIQNFEIWHLSLQNMFFTDKKLQNVKKNQWIFFRLSRAAAVDNFFYMPTA
jgi:hypothetical protein